jgi:glycosyltransferase involved in cell wall biosynthesis
MRAPGQISVIIPTYNRAPLLQAAVESVISQTSPPGEVIVVDDGSTDETAQVVKALQSGLPALSYVALEHSDALGLVRHIGIERARGTIIALLDSDDLWLPERVARQLESWNEHPGAGFAFCNVRRFDDSGLFPGGPWLDPGHDYSGRIVRDLLLEPVALPSALMFDRSLYDKIGPYSARPVNEDYEWLLEAASSYDADYVSEPLVHMRAHEGSRSREKSLRANTEYLVIVRRFMRAHPELTTSERRAARLGMANVHLKVAGQLLEARDTGQAARHAANAIRLHPGDRRSYGLLRRALLRHAAGGAERSKYAG